MSYERRRRDLAEWLSLGVKTAALIAAVWTAVVFIGRASDTVAYAQTSRYGIDSLRQRVAAIEIQASAMSYMTCVMFAETHPARQVPTYCDGFTRAR